MKKLWLVVLLGACGSNICTMDVASMTTETLDGKVDLGGTFDEAQPILILTSSAGTPTQIACSLNDGSTIAAVCDVKGANVAAGDYKVTFDMTCRDTSQSKDALAVGDTVATMITIN